MDIPAVAPEFECSHPPLLKFWRWLLKKFVFGQAKKSISYKTFKESPSLMGVRGRYKIKITKLIYYYVTADWGWFGLLFAIG